LEFFVKFFWILYLGEEGGFQEGVKLASSYCKKLGLDYCPIPPLKQFWYPQRDYLPGRTGYDTAANRSELEQSSPKITPRSTSQQQTQSHDILPTCAKSASEKHSSDDVHSMNSSLSRVPAGSNKRNKQSSSKRAGRNIEQPKDGNLQRPESPLSSLSSLSSLSPSPEAEPVPSSASRKRKAEQEPYIRLDELSTSVLMDVDGVGRGSHRAPTRAQGRSVHHPRRTVSQPSHGGKHVNPDIRRHRGTRPNSPNQHSVETSRTKTRKTSLVNAPDTTAIDPASMVKFDCDSISRSSIQVSRYSRSQDPTRGEPASDHYNSAGTGARTMRPVLNSGGLPSGSRSTGHKSAKNVETHKISKVKKTVRLPSTEAKQSILGSVRRMKNPKLSKHGELSTASRRRAGQFHASEPRDPNLKLSPLAIPHNSQVEEPAVVSGASVISWDPNERLSQGLLDSSANDHGQRLQAFPDKKTEILAPIRSNKPRPPLTVCPPIWAQVCKRRI
jgi:hypothetical protein